MNRPDFFAAVLLAFGAVVVAAATGICTADRLTEGAPVLGPGEISTIATPRRITTTTSFRGLPRARPEPPRAMAEAMRKLSALPPVAVLTGTPLPGEERVP